MPLDERIAEALRAADAETSWLEVSNALHALDPDGKDLNARPFYFAFSYTLLERTSPRRDRVGGPFGSGSPGRGGVPPEVSAIEDVDVQAWVDAFEEIDSPVVKARVGDLLFERGRDRAPISTRAAQAMPCSPWSIATSGPMDQIARGAWKRQRAMVSCVRSVLEKALEIARTFGLNAEADELRKELGPAAPCTYFSIHDVCSRRRNVDRYAQEGRRGRRRYRGRPEDSRP